MKLQGALEENILTVLCWNEQHAAELTLRLKPELFSTRAYRKVAETAFEHIERFSVPPRHHLNDLLEEAMRKGEEGKLLSNVVDAMARLAPELQVDYVMGELDRFIRTRQMTLALETASEALQRGELETAQEALYEQNLGSAPLTPGIWLTDAPRMLSVLDKREEDYISCGIDALDEREVRLAPKTMTTFIAPPKRGKSWWLVEVGKRALMHGHSVLHITLENSEELTARRYLQSLFAMSKAKAQQQRTAFFVRDSVGQCTAIEFNTRTSEALLEAPRGKLAERLRGFNQRAPFLIKEFPTGTLSISGLNSYLDMLKRQHNFSPDVMLVDYPDLMALDPANLRVSLGQTFVKLRGIFVARNIAGAVVTQGGRASTTAKVVSESHVAEDFSKIATSDTVLTYSQTGEERKLGLARILVSNARDAEDKYIALISQNYPTGQFCLDSIYMNQYLEQEINKLAGPGDANEAQHQED